jgi:LPXTG-motif cell wall-anchored protein
VRFVRPAIVVAFVVGAAVAIVTEWSFASPPAGQVGYGVQQVPDQVIDVHHTSGSPVGLWIGVVVAFALLAGAGFIGWRRSRSAPI